MVCVTIAGDGIRLIDSKRLWGIILSAASFSKRALLDLGGIPMDFSEMDSGLDEFLRNESESDEEFPVKESYLDSYTQDPVEIELYHQDLILRSHDDLRKAVFDHERAIHSLIWALPPYLRQSDQVSSLLETQETLTRRVEDVIAYTRSFLG